MNWQHLQAFVWLRWRLLRNQWRRAGALNCRADDDRVCRRGPHGDPAIHRLFMLGLYAIPKAAPAHLMYAWDGLIVAFLFFLEHRPDDRAAADRAAVAVEIPALARLGQRGVPDQLSQLAVAPEPDRLRAGDARV